MITTCNTPSPQQKKSQALRILDLDEQANAQVPQKISKQLG